MIGRRRARHHRGRPWMWSIRAVTLLSLLPVLAVSTASASPSTAAATGVANRVAPDVLDALQTADRTPVIVRYRDAAPAPAPTAAGDGLRRSALRTSGDRVLATLPTDSFSDEQRVDNFPLVAIVADHDAIEALATSPDVVSVSANRPHPAALSQSVPLIGGPVAYAAGYTGAGQTVAIVDTGVDASHPFLGGRVVAQACFSSNGGGATAVCPGVDPTTATGPGSAAPCPMSDCIHGTHVAGIAAGDNGTFNGVAKGANIIAVQIFSKYVGAGACNGKPECAMYVDFDLVRGLDFVYGLRSSYSIAAVNMSLGGFFSPGYCDYSPEEPIFTSLRNADIAPVVAAGNDGNKQGLAVPSCTSNAVSVGATTKADAVAGFSNSDPFLTVLAPGVSIDSSLPGGGFGFLSGTSMATPHVVGSFAVLRQQHPTWSVDDIASLLRATGLPITDPGNALTVPRVRLDGAVRPPTIHPIDGVRIVDTRDDPTPFSDEASRRIAIPVAAGVPADATAVVVNVTGIYPSDATHLTLFPSGYPKPATSNLNLEPGDVRASLELVKLGDGHTFTMTTNTGTVGVAIDVVGWVDDGGVDDTGARFVPTPATRVADTRNGTGLPAAKIGAGQSAAFGVAASCPAGSTAAALNVTVTGQSAATHFTVYPSGSSPGLYSNLNVPVGVTRANLTMVGLGADGKVAIRNNAGDADAVVDLYGCYGPAGASPTLGRLVPVEPVRIVDTRNGLGVPRVAKISGDGIQVMAVQAEGRGGVPSSGVRAVLVNLTATDNDTDTHLSVAPSAESLAPLIAALGTSVLNVNAGETAANLVEVALGPDGKFLVKTNAGSTDVLVDVVGWVEG
jgi:subtilisin family serine protease